MEHVFGAIPGVDAYAKQYINVVLGVLRHQKESGGDCLLGFDFSAADIMFVHCMDWAGSIGWLEDATMTNDQRSALRLYLDLCRSRPPYLRVALMRSTSHL
jgi:glutathione S-transferase